MQAMTKHSLRTMFIDRLLEANNIPARFTNTKGKQAKTVTGHYEGLRFVSPHRIKLESASGIVDLFGLETAVNNIGGRVIGPTKASGATIDHQNGFLVQWNGIEFVILLKGSVPRGQVRRKQTTPADLGLAGQFYDTVQALYTAVISGIHNCSVDNDAKSTLVDVTNSVYHDQPFTVTHSLTSSNFIQSDFGEVLAALKMAKSGAVTKFPIDANNDGVDFYADDIGYSVKAPNGDHLNLRKYRDEIKGTTPIELFFKACATSDYELLFKSLSTDSGVCRDLYRLVKRVTKSSDVTLDDIRKFMQMVDYRSFLCWVIKKQPGRRALGIPSDKKMHIAKDLWSKQDINPFFFTYITLAQKIWGASHSKEISDFAKQVLKQDTAVFITVNINLDNQKVEFAEQPFTEVNHWGIWYLGYCDQAVKNWPAICRTKDVS